MSCKKWIVLNWLYWLQFILKTSTGIHFSNQNFKKKNSDIFFIFFWSKNPIVCYQNGPYFGRIRAVSGPYQGRIRAVSGPYQGRIRAISLNLQKKTKKYRGFFQFWFPFFFLWGFLLYPFHFNCWPKSRPETPYNKKTKRPSSILDPSILFSASTDCFVKKHVPVFLLQWSALCLGPTVFYLVFCLGIFVLVQFCFANGICSSKGASFAPGILQIKRPSHKQWWNNNKKSIHWNCFFLAWTNMDENIQTKIVVFCYNGIVDAKPFLFCLL